MLYVKQLRSGRDAVSSGPKLFAYGSTVVLSGQKIPVVYPVDYSINEIDFVFMKSNGFITVTY